MKQNVKPPNYKYAKCCVNCKSHREVFTRCGDYEFELCEKHDNDGISKGGICDDFEWEDGYLEEMMAQ